MQPKNYRRIWTGVCAFFALSLLGILVLAISPATVAASPLEPPRSIASLNNGNPCALPITSDTQLQICIAAILKAMGTTSITTTTSYDNVPTGNDRNPNVTGTNCDAAEKTVTGKGTEQDPLIYPETYFHDSCFGWINGGTGTKYAKVPGPAAIQRGEASGLYSMIRISKGQVWTGWFQAFFRYVSDDAMMLQWAPKGEDLSAGLYGLICGYGRNNGRLAPAYRWNGTTEVRDTTLDCQLTPAQLGIGTTNSTAAPNASPANTGSMMDFQTYPTIFKFEWQGKFYCGAMAANAQFPIGYRHIEVHYKKAKDGNYLRDSSTYGMGKNAFCSGQPVDANGNPVSQKEWITVLLTGNGNLQEVSFPIK